MEHLKYPRCDEDKDCQRVNRREVCSINGSICVAPPTGLCKVKFMELDHFQFIVISCLTIQLTFILLYTYFSADYNNYTSP